MTRCPCCHKQTLHSFVQESLIPGKRPARSYCECHNLACEMYMVTLSPAEFEKRCRDSFALQSSILSTNDR